MQPGLGFKMISRAALERLIWWWKNQMQHRRYNFIQNWVHFVHVVPLIIQSKHNYLCPGYSQRIKRLLWSSILIVQDKVSGVGQKSIQGGSSGAKPPDLQRNTRREYGNKRQQELIFLLKGNADDLKTYTDPSVSQYDTNQYSWTAWPGRNMSSFLHRLLWCSFLWSPQPSSSSIRAEFGDIYCSKNVMMALGHFLWGMSWTPPPQSAGVLMGDNVAWQLQ